MKLYIRCWSETDPRNMYFSNKYHITRNGFAFRAFFEKGDMFYKTKHDYFIEL